MSAIRDGRSDHPALRGDNDRPGLPDLPRTVISAATSRCRYGACLVGRSGSRPAPASGMLGSRAPAFWWPPRPRPFAPGLTPQIPNAWGHVAGPPLLRITATVIKVTEVTSQIRTAVRCRPRPWSSAFPRRRRWLRRCGGWRSGDRTLSCAGISSLDASRLKPASSEASLGSVWPSALWMEFRAWCSQPAGLITGTCVAGSLDR